MGKTCGHVPPFAGFTEFVPFIPKMYWDTYSQEQRLHAISEFIHKLKCYAEKIGDETNINAADIERLEADFEKFKESGFEDYYEQQIYRWIADNLDTVLHAFIRQVYFGLTLEGRFVAYIPESWDDIQFDTGANYTLDTYGRLILRWDADSPYSADQKPEIVRPVEDAGLRQDVNNIMVTLYGTERGN